MFYQKQMRYETGMARRRGRRLHLEDLLPEDRQDWANGVWADREEVAKLQSGAWMLREAAKVLGMTEDVVDEVLRP